MLTFISRKATHLNTHLHLGLLEGEVETSDPGVLDSPGANIIKLFPGNTN
jgi:hypothetical protein